MLTDAALKNLKQKEEAYKVSDRDGMYMRVTTGGAISFSLDYRLNCWTLSGMVEIRRRTAFCHFVLRPIAPWDFLPPRTTTISPRSNQERALKSTEQHGTAV